MSQYKTTLVVMRQKICELFVRSIQRRDILGTRKKQRKTAKE